MKSLINTWSRLFSIILLIINTTNVSAGICDHLEFAELDYLTKEELLNMQCAYTRTFLSLPSNEGIGSGCAEEVERMNRILIKKYNLIPKSNSSYDITTEEGKASDLRVQLVHMCDKKSSK